MAFDSEPKKQNKIFTFLDIIRIIGNEIIKPWGILTILLSVFFIVIEAYYGLFVLAVFIAQIIFVILNKRTVSRYINESCNNNVLISKYGDNDDIITSYSNEVSIDDIIILKYHDSILFRSQLLTGSLLLLETKANGKTKLVRKKPGDLLEADSFIISGEGDAKVVALSKPSNKKKRDTAIYKFTKGFLVVSTFLALSIAFFTIGVGMAPLNPFKEIARFTMPLMILTIPSEFLLVKEISEFIHYRKVLDSNIKLVRNDRPEVMANIDMFCMEKTGVLTSGNYQLTNIIPLVNETETYIKSLIFRLLNATQDNDPVAIALLNVCSSVNDYKASDIMPLDAKNKYSAASFSDGRLYLGDVKHLPIVEKEMMTRKVNDYVKLGYKVRIIAKSSLTAKEATPIAILLLEEQIRDEAYTFISNALNSGKKIKIITGDNEFTTLSLLNRLKVDSLDKKISVAFLSDEELLFNINKYDVFTDCNAYQKELIIKRLKKDNKVGFIGNNNQDVLALNEADYGISLISSGNDVKNASDALINENNLDSIVNLEEDSVIYKNNFNKILSLFIAKSSIGLLLSLFFLVSSLLLNNGYLFIFNIEQFLIIEIAFMITASICVIYLEDKRNNNSIFDILHFALPSSLLTFVGVAVIFGFYMYGKENGVFNYITSVQQASGLASIYMLIMFIALYIKIVLSSQSVPWYLVFFGMFIPLFFSALGFIFTRFGPISSFFGIYYASISGSAYFIGGLVLLISLVLFFVITTMLESFVSKETKEEFE